MNIQHGDLNEQDDFSNLKPILIVEDTKVLSLIMVMQFTKKGIPHELANDGDEAVKIFSPGKYSLILMDCQMPVMDGYMASRRIREIEGEQGNTNIPIIALTAEIMPGIEQKCKDSGMDDYITKPVKLMQIIDIIMKWTKVN